jgi:hypothetical protein
MSARGAACKASTEGENQAASAEERKRQKCEQHETSSLHGPRQACFYGKRTCFQFDPRADRDSARDCCLHLQISSRPLTMNSTHYSSTTQLSAGIESHRAAKSAGFATSVPSAGTVSYREPESRSFRAAVSHLRHTVPPSAGVESPGAAPQRARRIELSRAPASLLSGSGRRHRTSNVLVT